MVLCAHEERGDDGLLADSHIIADILAGYASDPWFAEEANISKGGLHLENDFGLCGQHCSSCLPLRRRALSHRLNQQERVCILKP